MGVSILSAEKGTLFEKGVLRLTTHCMCWMNASYSKAFHMPNSLISAVEEHNSGFIGSRRAQLKIFVKTNSFFRLDFDGGGRDKAYQSLESAIKKKLWLKKSEQKKEDSIFDSQTAGISGIIRKVEKKNESDAQSVQAAFSDMNVLLESADDLVKIAKKLERVKNANSKEDNSELSQMMMQMGIITPITKENSGSLYHEELARQICQFLVQSQALMKNGMSSLSDIYCAYNRARGTDLISPEDLYRAASLMEPLGLPLRLREFQSGVKVIEDSKDSKTMDQIMELFSEDDSKGFSALDLAEKFGMSLTLGQQMFLEMEDKALVCRDESVQGLFFYKNKFCEEQ